MSTGTRHEVRQFIAEGVLETEAWPTVVEMVLARMLRGLGEVAPRINPRSLRVEAEPGSLFPETGGDPFSPKGLHVRIEVST